MSHYSKYFSECNNSMWGDTHDRCGATLWSPSLEEHFVEDRAFSLYAMECEGEIPTRLGQLNQVVKLMVDAGSIRDDFNVQCQIYDIVGIDSDTFSDEEIRYMESEIAKRL